VGRLKVLVCAYRKWAKKIIVGLDHDFYMVTGPKHLMEAYKHFKPQVVVLLGWSWIVPKEIYKKTPTICLHPSPLPKYRGGSPIQHQIMAGEKKSKVTYFLVDDGIDTGPILAELEFPLGGKLKDIFNIIGVMGKSLLRAILDQYPNFKTKPQRGIPYTYPRRQPYESELTVEDFQELTAEELYNFIRALADPYPNAFIRCSDGEKLYFKEVALGTQLDIRAREQF
jgi:methionyl-tRNA formyltransferase